MPSVGDVCGIRQGADRRNSEQLRLSRCHAFAIADVDRADDALLGRLHNLDPTVRHHPPLSDSDDVDLPDACPE